MKDFVQQFVPEYNRISGMDSFAEHDINRRFLFTNGAIISAIGLMIFLMVGWVFHLLGNRSYIFYGYNAIFIITLFLLIYSTEIQRHEDVDEPYSIWVMIISRGFGIMDAMVLMWSLLFFVFRVQLFNGLEGSIYNIVVLLYLIVSIGLRRQLGTLIVGIPLVLIMAAMLLFFGSYPMIVQYGISLLFLSLVFYLKDNAGISIFTTKTSTALIIGLVSVVLLVTVIRDNDIVGDNFDPIDNIVLELSSDQSNSEMVLDIQYFGYSFATRYEDAFSTIDIYDEQFQLVTSYQIETTENLHLSINFETDTVQVAYKDEEILAGYKLLEINSSLEVVDLGMLTFEKFSDTSKYTIADETVLGSVVFQNIDYIITDEGEEEKLHIYKRFSSGFEFQGDVTRDILSGYYDSTYERPISILHMIDDVFVFGENRNDDLLLYLVDTKGNIIGSTYTGDSYHRGNETYFSNSSSSASSSESIYGIYYKADGTPMISYHGYYLGRQLLDVKKMNLSTLNLGFLFKNNTEIASVLFLCGLLIPITNKEGE